MLINKESYEDMVEAIKSKVSFKHPIFLLAIKNYEYNKF